MYLTCVHKKKKNTLLESKKKIELPNALPFIYFFSLTYTN